MPRARPLPITRERRDGSWVYLDGRRKVTARREIARIESLAVPPAWTDVEIARSSRSKVLARGLDAAGRTQAIYSPSFRRRRDREKFDRMVRLGRALPRLRAQVEVDLRARRVTRARVIAGVVRLIDEQLFRLGSAVNARRYGSYGVTTLQSEHVRVSGRTVEFDFVGKSGVRHRRATRDARAARLIRDLAELPGPELFACLDDSEGPRAIRGADVNAYIRRHAGAAFSAKDFRTWGATVAAAGVLMDLDVDELRDPQVVAAAVRRAVNTAAEALGNTPAVARSSYIDPRLFAALDASDSMVRARRKRGRMRPRTHQSVAEQFTLLIITRRAAQPLEGAS